LILALRRALELMGIFDVSGLSYEYLKDSEKQRSRSKSANWGSDSRVSSFRFTFCVGENTRVYKFSIDTYDGHVVSESYSEIIDDKEYLILKRDEKTVTIAFNVIDNESLGIVRDRLLITVDNKHIKDIGTSKIILSMIFEIRAHLAGTVVMTYDYGSSDFNNTLYGSIPVINTDDCYLCSVDDFSILEKYLVSILNIKPIKRTPLLSENRKTMSFHSFFYFNEGTFFYFEGSEYCEIVFEEIGQQRLRTIEELSSGTKRIIQTLLAAFSAVESAKICSNDVADRLQIKIIPLLVVDELCYSIHPDLARKLLHSIQEIGNDKHLHIIFTAHNTEIMIDCGSVVNSTLLINNKAGSSELYLVSDFKGITEWTDEEIRSGYLDGRFDSVPEFLNYRRLSNNDS
jgi:hypothetical protein